jgi:hypothetical protein
VFGFVNLGFAFDLLDTAIWIVINVELNRLIVG